MSRDPVSSRRSLVGLLILGLSLGCAATAVAQYQGWLIPPGGKDEMSPLKPGPDVFRKGQALFLANCARCHGTEGKGDGRDSDHAADLTDPLRDAINTEGVLFYKVWNGHAIQLRVQIDDMPAPKDKLAREDVWALVEYLKMLRTPAR
jgi:mono/diheme cytochrome c family protein